MRRPPSHRLAAAVAAVAGLAGLLAGCGEDGSGGEAGAGAGTMTVVGTEMAFQAPERVAAGDYEVAFRNEGAVYHELAFTSPSGEVVARRSIAGGRDVLMEVTLDEPGTWELGCFEPGHYEAGMHAPLVVE